ncbi:MAG: HAMP domain-containing protein [Sphingobium sp.]|nr:HAMP domain-containing protein [Sphingobium sp.]
MTAAPSFLSRFRPRTLAGQTILVVAISLFVVQLIGVSVYYLAQRNQWLNVAAAPGVIVVLELLDQRENRSGLLERARIQGGLIMSKDAPRPIGEDASAVAGRAMEMFHSAGLAPLEVRASINRPPMRPRLRRLFGPISADRTPPPPRVRVQLSVKVAQDRWVTVFSRAAPIEQPILQRALVQTLFLYGMVLIPLVWFTRRLAAPLRALASATTRVGTPEGAPPVPEVGPDDVRRLAASFNAMQDRIRSMLEEKDHMLGAIGHDLRTPLTALRVRVESVPEGPDRDRMIGTIDDMRQMLDDILALARIGRDREPPQKVDLSALAEAAIDDFLDTGAKVDVDEDMPRAIVNVHPRGVRRAVSNLIDNALKYGGSAEVSLRIEQGAAILSVADRGPGIAPERIEEMMQPFTRMEGSRSRDTGGAGLGLAIVRAIASSESGQFTLTNREGSGLVAEISLPIAR